MFLIGLVRACPGVSGGALVLPAAAGGNSDPILGSHVLLDLIYLYKCYDVCLCRYLKGPFFVCSGCGRSGAAVE